MTNIFKQVSDERYDIIMSRNAVFQASMGDFNRDVISVFDPLTKKQIEELELIREVSRVLQKNKEEDINKAAVILAYHMLHNTVLHCRLLESSVT